MKSHPVLLVGVFVLLGSPVGAQTLKIDHEGVGCAVAEKFPRLTARFSPMDTLATARVVFQGETIDDWFSVGMKPDGLSLAGVLPKPKKSLKAFRYYIEATDKALGTVRTPEYTTTVVGSSGACKGKVVAGTAVSASVVVQGPAGSAVIPPGFASAGVVGGAAAGAAVAGAAIAGGGGLSGGALIGIVAGVGAAAAAGVAVAGKSGGDTGPGTSGPQPTPTPAPTTSYTGPFAGQRTIQQTHIGGPGGCQTVTATLIGTMTVTLNPSSNGTLSTTGAYTVISNTGNCAGQGTKVGDTSGINWNGPVTGSPGNLMFSAGNVGETISFSGALNGGVISGTMTFTHMVQTSTTTSTGATSIPVTLR